MANEETTMKRTLLAIFLIVLCFTILASCNQKPKGTPSDDITCGTFIVVEVSESNILVADIGEGGVAIETMQYSVPNWFHPSVVDIKIGDKITIYTNGEVLETYPMQFAEIQKMEYKDVDGCITTVIPD